MHKIFMATHNKGKVAELQAFLDAHNIQVISANDINYPEPEETGSTFEENSAIKALAGFQASGLPTIADDSGICIDALNGEPGVYSARLEGTYNTVLQKLDGNPNRSAYFVCVITYIDQSGVKHVFRGESHGLLSEKAKGNMGFAYDIIFIPQGESRTYAEMTKEEKAKTSHRAMALQKFIAFLNEQK